ncbi:hypothetical protein BKA93DRAFT_146353 [Sparassis latifolia]
MFVLHVRGIIGRIHSILVTFSLVCRQEWLAVLTALGCDFSLLHVRAAELHSAAQTGSSRCPALNVDRNRTSALAASSDDTLIKMNTVGVGSPAIARSLRTPTGGVRCWTPDNRRRICGVCGTV